MISDLEKKVLTKLYQEYKKTGKKSKLRALDVFQDLGIENGMDVSTLNDSKYVAKVLEGTHDCFLITEEGIRFMDQQQCLDDLTIKTDKELEVIIRRMENPNVPGSLHQRAKMELELRDRKRSQERQIEKKWWEQTPVQIIMVVGAIAGIIGLILLFVL